MTDFKRIEDDKDFVKDILTKGQNLVDKATELENEIIKITESKLTF